MGSSTGRPPAGPRAGRAVRAPRDPCRPAPRALDARGIDELHGLLPQPFVVPVGARAVRGALARGLPGSERRAGGYFRLLEEVLAGFSFRDIEGSVRPAPG